MTSETRDPRACFFDLRTSLLCLFHLVKRGAQVVEGRCRLKEQNSRKNKADQEHWRPLISYPASTQCACIKQACQH
jgi:hypothetical protein